MFPLPHFEKACNSIKGLIKYAGKTRWKSVKTFYSYVLTVFLCYALVSDHNMFKSKISINLFLKAASVQNLVMNSLQYMDG